MQHEILLRPHEEAYIKEHKSDLKRFLGMDLVFEARMRFLEMPPDERAKLCPGWLEEDQPLWQEGSIPLSSVIDEVQAAPFTAQAPVVPLPALEDAPAGGTSSVASARGDAGEPGEEPAPEPGSAGAENGRTERRAGPATLASATVMSELEAVQDVRSILEAAGGAK
mmetsp:Transcript_41744/g.97477  ORF Transcript_41744/g.97477 Transcript_41744/m.97477 type:complete len:167 (-) Transcript_41744:103-603(-)|eukprot:s660_g31.t1